MATRRSNLTEEQKEAKRQEWLETIEADPELFLSLAEETPVGRRMISAIRRLQKEETGEKIADDTNTAEFLVSRNEAMESLDRLQNTQYTRIRYDFMRDGPDHNQGYVSGNIPFTDLAVLVEYARQQVVNDNPDLYVLMDSREAPDNKMLFWGRNAQGYTTDLAKAHRFTREEAEAQFMTRATDIPYRVGDLSPASKHILENAAAEVARSKAEYRATNDPTATTRAHGFNLDTMKMGKGHRAAGLYALFNQKTHANDRVMLVADKAAPAILDTVLVNPDDYQVEASEKDANRITRLTTLAEFAAAFHKYPNAHSAMNYNSWEQFVEFVSPELQDQGNREMFNNTVPLSLTNNLPPDLPPKVAQQRLALLDTFANPQNLKAKVQLSDIDMASLYGEPVNEHLFEAHQITPTWRDRLESYEVGDLYERGDEFRQGIKELIHEISTTEKVGLTVSDTMRFSLALTRQTLDECNVMIESINARSYRQMQKTEQAASQGTDANGDSDDPDFKGDDHLSVSDRTPDINGDHDDPDFDDDDHLSASMR